MKPQTNKCFLCGLYFPVNAPKHTCGSLDVADAINAWLDGTDVVSRELADPALKARIQAGVEEKVKP